MLTAAQFDCAPDFGRWALGVSCLGSEVLQLRVCSIVTVFHSGSTPETRCIHVAFKARRADHASVQVPVFWFFVEPYHILAHYSTACTSNSQ